MSSEDSQNTEEFYKRAEESRERLAQSFDLKSDPEKFSRLQTEGRQTLNQQVPEAKKANTPLEFAASLDSAAAKIGKLFPGEYGARAKEAFTRRTIEKARDEISDWLNAQNKKGLAFSLFVKSKEWKNAKEGAGWIEANILSQFENPQELFESARDSKIQEFEEFIVKSEEN